MRCIPDIPEIPMLDLTRIPADALDHLRSEGWSDREIMLMEPRKVLETLDPRGAALYDLVHAVDAASVTHQPEPAVTEKLDGANVRFHLVGADPKRGPLVRVATETLCHACTRPITEGAVACLDIGRGARHQTCQVT